MSELRSLESLDPLRDLGSLKRVLHLTGSSGFSRAISWDKICLVFLMQEHNFVWCSQSRPCLRDVGGHTTQFLRQYQHLSTKRKQDAGLGQREKVVQGAGTTGHHLGGVKLGLHLQGGDKFRGRRAL